MDKSKDLEEKIKIIQQIKKFGQKELKLDFKDAFEEYTHLKKFGWMYVTPKYKLKSIFNEPYKFYRDIGELERGIKFYSDKGFDTHGFLGEATGNKKCPITLSLLNERLIRQAWVIFHEGWHMTNSGTSNVLEEASGNFIGCIGAILFLGKYFPELKGDAEYQFKELKKFSNFAKDYFMQLKEVFTVKTYDFKRKEKLRILNEARKKRDKSVKQIRTEWIKNRYSQELNNAFFYRWHFYCLHYDLIDGVYQKIQDLDETIKVLKRSLKKVDGVDYLNNFLKK